MSGAAPLSAKEQEAARGAWKELGVCDELCAAAAQMRWKQPTEVQTQAIPLLLEGATPSPRAWDRQ